MASPSASLTEIRLDKARVWAGVVLTVLVVTTGELLTLGPMVKGAQLALSAALQALPSKTRICRSSLTVPVTKLVCAAWAAVRSSVMRAGCVTPLTVKWPLLGRLEER